MDQHRTYLDPGDLPEDAAGVCAALVEAQRDLVDAATRQLVLAARWLDVHAPTEEPDASPDARRGGPGGRRPPRPGQERVVASGADGTPTISEFACAEFAALLEMHPLAGRSLLRKVANLRHRHPQLWLRVLRGQVRGWKALETARLVGRDDLALTRDQAHWIDEHSHQQITTLPWAAYLEHLERLIIDADPHAAETRRLEAETRQGVWTTQTGEHGLKTIIARAAAGEIIYLTAVLDRLAEILALRGDARDLGPRRATALNILAHPAHALSLLAQHTATAPDNPGEHGDPGDNTGDPGENGDTGSAGDAPERDSSAGDGPEGHGSAGDGPQGDTAGDPEPDPEPEPETEPEHAALPSYLGCPEDLRAALALLDRLGGPGLARLLPPATLYVHIDRHALTTGQGSAHVEGIGALTLQQACALLGHRRVKLTEVIDLAAGHDPVDGYAHPARMREHLHLTNPRDVFPFAPNTSRRKDIDHPIPYRPPDTGGPPGQTGLHNAAPLTRFHHRLKTFGDWKITQLDPTSYLWRSPHGYAWLTDPNGTHHIPHAALPYIRPEQQTEDGRAA
jgi:hypothetical protein